MLSCEAIIGILARLNFAMFIRSWGSFAEGDVTGSVHKVLSRVDVVGRHLHHERIADAVLRIEPEIRRHLQAVIERNEHIAGNRLLAEPEFAGKIAVDIDSNRGRIRHLENVGVDHSRHARRDRAKPLSASA